MLHQEETDGEVKINIEGKKRWVILALVVGIIIGFVYCRYAYKSTPDDVIDYFEKAMNEAPTIRKGIMNNQTRISDISRVYNTYKIYARPMLVEYLSGICGGNWNVDRIRNISAVDDIQNITDGFCMEVCDVGK